VPHLLARLGLLAVILLPACSSTEPGPTERERLEAALRLWESQAATSYVYEFHFLCGYCPADFGHRRRILVEGEVITQVVDLIASDEVEVDERSSTILRLFQDLRDNLEATPWKLEVSYHPTLGYPTSLFIDLREAVQDDEFGYTAENLVVLRQQ